jgi:hypothetical protein
MPQFLLNKMFSALIKDFIFFAKNVSKLLGRSEVFQLQPFRDIKGLSHEMDLGFDDWYG